MSLSKAVRDLVLKNITLKILALIFAVVLWFFVVGEKGTEIGFLVPLELKGIPEGYVITNDVKNFVEVRLSGPRTLLTSLSPGEMRISVDLSRAREGKNTFRILPDDIKVPRGIKVTTVRPDSITVVLARLVTREIPVEAVVRGVPSRGFRVKEVTVRPEKVSVTGIGRELRRIRKIKTHPVDIRGIQEGFTREVTLELPPLNIVRVNPDTVEVTLILERMEEGRDGK